jgi:hypothetical protein
VHRGHCTSLARFGCRMPAFMARHGRAACARRRPNTLTLLETGSRQSPSPLPPETYTHLFMLCPSYRPVIVWLCSLWEALTGARPPMDPAVIIAAEPEAWPAAPPGARLLAWHAIRLTVLYAIWSARVDGAPEKTCPSAVARHAVALLREEIALQFRRSRQRQHSLQFLPPRLLGTHRLQPAEDGFAAWSDIGLCTVLGSSSAESPGGAGHLVVLLTNTFPVPLPAGP